jgi:hypothetical protein
VKILAWFSLSSITLGLVIAASPYLLLLILGGDSEEGAALGWVFLFFALPVGLLLITAAVILIVIAGIRGMNNGGSRLFAILAITGACGSVVFSLGLFALVIDQLMMDYSAPTNPLLPILAVVSTALLILGLVSTFVLAFSSPPRFAGGEDSLNGGAEHCADRFENL